MSQEIFKNEVLESVEVNYDKKTQMYIASVKFEDNPRKANVIVSANNEIDQILQ